MVKRRAGRPQITWASDEAQKAVEIKKDLPRYRQYEQIGEEHASGMIPGTLWITQDNFKKGKTYHIDGAVYMEYDYRYSDDQKSEAPPGKIITYLQEIRGEEFVDARHSYMVVRHVFIVNGYKAIFRNKVVPLV